MRAPFLGLLAMAFLGCFDPTSPAGSGTDGSQDSSGSGTGGGCSQGSSGCPCYGNATCDAGLECNATVELCIPEDCAPGSDGCTCNDGACLAGLECSAGVCVMPGSTTQPGTTDPATSDPATSDPATTDPATDPATTDPATTDPVTTDSATTDSATTDPSTTDATDTDPTSPCAGDCATCLQCAVGGGTVCDDPAMQCGADQACNDLFSCCATGDAELCALCCADYPDAVPTFNALAACVNDNLLCPDCGIPTC